MDAGVHPDLYARLTDRQIADIYAHTRDESGRLTVPVIPNSAKTLVQELLEWESACNLFNVKPEDRKKGEERIREKHGAA